jgi:hypothetical protein
MFSEGLELGSKSLEQTVVLLQVSKVRLVQGLESGEEW